MANEENIAAAHWGKWAEKLGSPMVLVASLILSIAAVYAMGDAVLALTPVPEQPGFVDVVLGSHSVVAALRIAIIFAGCFVVASVVALMARGQWLVRVGPVEVSERVADLKTENRRLKELLNGAEETISNLRYDLVESNVLLEKQGSSGEAE